VPDALYKENLAESAPFREKVWIFAVVATIIKWRSTLSAGGAN
jgi:hypothetical protein